LYNNIVVVLLWEFISKTFNQKKEAIMIGESQKKIFNPRIEMFSAFSQPFAITSTNVIDKALEKAAACCACTACTACR